MSMLMLCYCSFSYSLCLMPFLSMEYVNYVYTKRQDCHKNLSSTEAKKCLFALNIDKQINFMLC